MWLINLILTGLMAVFASGAIGEAGNSIAAPKLFSEICVAWHLSPSNIVGKGWGFSGFCKNSSGIYGWDDQNRLDDCVGTDDGGRLTHESLGKMSHRCTECNNNDGWGHTSSLDHALVCNCTNAHGSLVESSLDLDTTYGYWNNRIGCIAPPSTPAKPPSVVRDLKPYGHSSLSLSPTSTASPAPLSNGGPGFATNCNPRFQVTGNLPHFGSYDPRIMWAECVDDQGVWANTSLDLGFCFGVSHGLLVPQKLGLFNETCFDCVQDIDVLPATLLCHCPNDPVFNKSTTYNVTTITIEPTIQVIDGILSCFGIYGDRGLAAPSEFTAVDLNMPVVSEDHQLPASTSSGKSLERFARAIMKKLVVRADDTSQDHCCFWESCSHTMAMRQPEPWLLTRCRRIHEKNPTLVARFDLSKAFKYDHEDWTIKPGEGLYDDGRGCKDCHTDGSWMFCECSQGDGNFTEKSIDLNEHISNINGTLCSSSYCGDYEGPTAPIEGVW